MNVFHGQMIDELAEKLGMDSSILSATYSTEQAACASGNDEAFGKSV